MVSDVGLLPAPAAAQRQTAYRPPRFQHTCRDLISITSPVSGASDACLNGGVMRYFGDVVNRHSRLKIVGGVYPVDADIRLSTYH